jgi:ATP-dependent RNA helicase DDX23/PRP28
MLKPKFFSKAERERLALEQKELAKHTKVQKPSEPIKKRVDTEWKDEDRLEVQRRYMGIQERKPKKIRKSSDKKFVFDWAPEEDTGQNQVSYQSSIIGRSFIGGVDANAQAEERSKIYQKALKGRHDASPFFSLTSAKKEDQRHWSSKPLDEMKERDWRILREDFEIAIKGKDLPNPLRSWDESDVPDRIKRVIKSIGYKEPTPIQRAAIPIGLQNRDLIGIAETGSGKTASFVIPMLTYISALPPINDQNYHLGPYGLILAPTRELVQQIELETNKFAKGLNFIAVSLVGGHSIGEQAFNLRDGSHIVM